MSAHARRTLRTVLAGRFPSSREQHCDLCGSAHVYGLHRCGVCSCIIPAYRARFAAEAQGNQVRCERAECLPFQPDDDPGAADAARDAAELRDELSKERRR